MAVNSGGGQDDGAVWLWSQRQAFLERLNAEAYASCTLQDYQLITRRFCEAIEKRTIGAGELDGVAMERLCRAVLTKLPQHPSNHVKHRLGLFIDYLTEAGFVASPQPRAKKLTARERLREEYLTYLRKQCALAESTIHECMYFFDRFLAFRFGDKLGDLNAITPDDVVAFLCQTKPGSRVRGQRAVPSRLRTLFKFLFWSGKTKRNLVHSLPRVAQPKTADLPRYLSPEEIRRLIEAVRTNDATGRRNYAMLLLVARLGLRAPEVIAIQLDDIDWRAGEILIRGKGKLHDRMPLPAEVGEAMVEYIRNGRVGDSRALFVSARAPHVPFKDGGIVNEVLRDAFEKTGLKPPQKWVGSHVLRHSLATDMLHKGASLDEIADVLRHRSRITTTIYAKYDIDALRSIARGWPVGGDLR